MEKDFVRYNDILELRGEAAEGAADKWLDAVQRDTQSRLEKMDPARRDSYLARISPWIAGKYENLLRHERREVRRGRIERLERDNAADGEREAFDVQKQAVNMDECFADETRLAGLVRDDILAKGGDGAKEEAERNYAERMADIGARRAKETEALVLQIGATGTMGEDRIGGAVESGLIDEATGEAMRRRHRRGVLSSAVNALLAADKADQADAFLSAMEANDGAIAKSAGFMPDELAKMRAASAAARKRAEADAKAAEAERQRAEKLAEAERQRAAEDEIAKENIAAARVPFPETADERGVQAEAEAARFDRYAEDERLPPAARAKYAETARSVRAAERRLRAEEKAAAQKAKEKAAAEAEKAATEAEKRRVEGVKQSILTMEGRIDMLRASGSAEDARKANELEGDLYLAMQKGFADGKIPAETYRGYMKERSQQLTADERRAMAKFDAAMGLLDDFEADDSGEVKNAASLKSKWFATTGNRAFTSDNVLAFRKRFLGELRRLGKDVSREEAVAKCIDKVCAEAFARKFGEEADAAVIAALEEAQGEVRAAAATRGKREEESEKEER